MKSELQNRIVANEALRIALVEAGGILNSCSITHVSCDAGDIEALTLNHFLLLREHSSYEEADVSVCVRERDQLNELSREQGKKFGELRSHNFCTVLYSDSPKRLSTSLEALYQGVYP